MNLTRLTLDLVATAWLASACVGARAAAADWTVLETQFRELPGEARRWTGPLFWLHGDESRERLEMYVGKVAEGGNGCLTTESRPHNDWLGPNWFRDVGICLAEAKRQGLKLWIFDEAWWPSQGVAGKVPARYAAKQLEAHARVFEGPGTFEAEGYRGEDFIAVLAGRTQADEAVAGASLVDLTPQVRDGRLVWQAPAGRWQIMRFSHRLAPGLGQGGGKQLSVDGMSQDCVDWFLQTVYQPHYDRFKEDFGRNILGFFYDEPETRGDWGTALNAVLAEQGVDWKKAYVAYKFRLAGEEQTAARFQYLDARAETWGRTMYGGITRWCEAHGVKSIGHFMEHANMYAMQDFCAGDLMRVQKYSSMGGIDAVFSQFAWGRRAAYDPPCWQTPKLGSSITHAYGKPDDVSMVEIFGARGQDLTYPEMKWWADHMQVSGVNFLIPHSFNPRAPRDTDCPPYFYNGGFEPRWPLYRVFADYSSRLSTLLTGGEHRAPVALLTPGQSAHVGRHVLPEQVSEALQDALYDCDWLPYEVFEKDCTLAARELRLRREAYRILLMPAVEAIPHATLAKAKEFFDRGGVVVAYGFLPTRSATLGRGAAEIGQMREALWGPAQPGLSVCKTSPAGGRSYLLPEKPTPEQFQQVLATDAGVRPTLEVVEGRTDHWLHVLHRVKAGRDLFFIANQNHQGEARRFRFRIEAAGYPECWDAMRNEIAAVPFQREGRWANVTLTLQPNESVLLMFGPEQRSLPLRWEPGSVPPQASLTVTRDPSPVVPEPVLDAGIPRERQLEGCAWVWYPEADPAVNAPPGARGFRKQVVLPAGRSVTRATFFGTADNHLTLIVNGVRVGRSDDSGNGWGNPRELDARAPLREGVNQLAILAVNGSDKPNPAGLIGRLTIEFAQGEPLTVLVDKSWRTSREQPAGWTEAAFDDATWVPAKEVAAYGSGPWGRPGGGMLTLSPAKADPFDGHVDLTAAALGPSKRLYLEMDGVAPETAARVTVNGQYAGGAIGQPLRVDVSRYLKAGRNTLRIEPFAPRAATLAVYE